MSVQLQFALVDGIKMLPRHENGKPLHGICPHCGGEVVAKIYQDRMSHWAHLNSEMCDKWWESKTPWHIQWQNLFPKEWQEIRVDNSKDVDDWHIADVCTADGLVVEFQHSHIKEEQQKEREQFYSANTKGIVWVVDIFGKRDVSKIIDIIPSDVINGVQKGWWMIQLGSLTAFPKQWRNSKHIIFYDVQFDSKRYLLCMRLCMVGYKQRAFLFGIPHEEFSQIVYNCEMLVTWNKNVQEAIKKWLLEHRPNPINRGFSRRRRL